VSLPANVISGSNLFWKVINWNLIMSIQYLVGVLSICVLAGAVQTRAEESFVTHRSLAPGIALELAQARSGRLSRPALS
jgi:hypothetical protein